MAVTFGFSLSVSWICCLLIGGITCSTLQGNAYGHPASTGTEPIGAHAQASVVSVPNAKPTGHNSPANVMSGPNTPSEATGPRASAEATGPRASAEATGPRASAEATGPRASAEATGPRASAEATGPRASAEATSLEQTAQPLNKLDREIIIWFAQLLNRLSPVTLPPFEEKGKGN
ncbi:uncharacterized protein DKFZp434B061-like [Salvelinus fontinalis]|uniref:uncharacterized protein DKFZp434B061-like n=1 Tax=Salvelinus fontinalis TaxID=8038 RepID=UPI002485DDBB|nr:uncharacterized protein DKFZp434B061-like [Salvelinus fontinalis]